MNFNIGNDIIETKRIEHLCKKYNERFKNRVFTVNEIEYCEGKGVSKYQSYAARFAAKEAVFKAISCLLSNKYKIEWKDIEVINDNNGKPHVNLNNINCPCSVEISMSHVKEYAIATALAFIE